MRTFTDVLARREQVPLLLGLFGPSGSGKTFSALELATGIQQVTGGDIHVIDTEARRSLHYADRFRFRHVQFDPPFASLDYADAIEHCTSRGAGVVVVDSMSHEHEGPGGYLELAESEIERMAGSDWGRRQACKLASFIKPAQQRRAMINRILQVNANFIFCFRAKDKVRPEKNNQGKTVIENLGFMPIAGMELVFEMTACCLLGPRSGGVPTWQTDFPGEKAVMKLPVQFEKLLTDGKPLSVQTGRMLAEWAQGAPPPAPPPPPAPAVDFGFPPEWGRLEQGESVSRRGMDALRAWWSTLSKEEKTALKGNLDGEWKANAQAKDSEVPNPHSSHPSF